ncbi:MAG: AI-2E family transporter [Eubacteriales bacterium]|nr:AI-2E family transporter [Eubacteriales bacterium]
MEEEKKKQDKTAETPEGYYSNKPKIGNKGPSRLRREISKGMTYFVVVAAGIVFYFALLRLTNLSAFFVMALDVLKPILYGALIAFLLNPIVKQVDKRLEPVLKKRMKEESASKLSRTAGILLSLIVLFMIITALFNMLIPELYQSIRTLVFTLPRQINELMDRLNGLETDNSNMGVMIRTLLEQATATFQDWLTNNIFRQANDIMTILTTGVIDFVSEIFNALIGVIVSIYILYSKDTFGKQGKKITYALLDPHHANLVLHITQKANEIFGGFLIGKIVDSMIIGVLCFLGLSALSMPYTLLVSVIVGVTNVIPFFGPYIGAIPSAILILLADPMKGVYFLIFILILQQIDGNFIGPKILGNSTGLSSFWVIFAILLGGGLFGFMGMLLGVPTFAVIYYILQMIINSRLQKKNLPEDTEYYDEYSFVDDSGKYIISKETLAKKQKEKSRQTEEETIEKKQNRNKTEKGE